MLEVKNERGMDLLHDKNPISKGTSSNKKSVYPFFYMATRSFLWL